MAKLAPVMKHSKTSKLTAEQIAIEDFMNSIPPAVVVEGDTIIDNTIQETMIVEDTNLDPIVDSAVVADNLDELAEDVDGITTAPAMESYKRIFTQITEMTGHPIIGLENFPATKGGKRKLAKAIRSHADEIRSCIGTALEDYVDKIDESIGTAMSNYKQALGALAKVREENIDVEGDVTINHNRVWKLFHLNDDLMDLKDFKIEIDGIKELAAVVTKAKERLIQWSNGEDSPGMAIEGKKFVQLMNNTDVTIKDGRVKFDELPVPKPSKEWTGEDILWVFLFNVVGLTYRLIKGGSGEAKTKKEQSLKAIAMVIEEMKKLAPVVQGIEKDADEIIKVISKAKTDRQADLKRAASPVLELASKTIQHVTDVTYGAKKIFEAAEGK